MPHKFDICYFVHSVSSDWNNGNAHFLRGLGRALGAMGHSVTFFEPQNGWSIENLLTEPSGSRSLDQFAAAYPDLHVVTYSPDLTEAENQLRNADIVIVHEWNSPELVEVVLRLRDKLGFRALFHDTHHRASSSPDQIAQLQIRRFDGVMVFGEALRAIYRQRFGLARVWTLHEAADTTVFTPRPQEMHTDVVWIGNWGDNERSEEIREFLVGPAARLREYSFRIYGVRYPREGLDALSEAGITYAGYLPNLDAAALYNNTRLTVHIPRQQYCGAMTGIPTIRVFEALASGIPLISAPWRDTEHLFCPGDFVFAESGDEMMEAMRYLLEHPAAAREQADRGLRTVRNRHTCMHRAEQLTQICEELLSA